MSKLINKSSFEIQTDNECAAIFIPYKKVKLKFLFLQKKLCIFSLNNNGEIKYEVGGIKYGDALKVLCQVKEK